MNRLAKLIIFINIVIILSASKTGAFFNSAPQNINFNTSLKTISITDNGLNYLVTTSTNTASDLLKEKSITLGDHDQIFPAIDSPIYPGTSIIIRRAVKITIQADGKTIDGYTLANNIRDAVTENGVTLNRLDKTTPDLDALPQNNLTIIVTRINVEEITQDEDIPFRTITKNDSAMGWRQKVITTTGQNGTMEVLYRITYKNNQEVSRVALSKTVVSQPVIQVETQGTYMQLGKANKGQGTWYSYMGGMFAASTTIPEGSYAKVTNAATGKSIVVQINDYGPQGKGRIIDLDKVAFQKIAPLGAGIIGVKVEQILN